MFDNKKRITYFEIPGVFSIVRIREGGGIFSLCDVVTGNRNLMRQKLIENSFYFIKNITSLFFFYWRYNPLWVCILQPYSGDIASSHMRFLDHTQRRATVGRTSLDE